MKKSNYNFIYEYESDYLIYNSLKNSLAVLTDKELNDFNNDNLSYDEISQFKYGGFLIDDDFDELDYIKFNLLNSRYDKSSLGLTIAPTLDCNFACEYCYEKEHSEKFYMKEEVEKYLLDFVREKAKSSNRIDVSWYGGEPLLNYKTIDRLTQGFLKIADENNIIYRSYIITNGYLLNEKIAKKLSSWKIQGMQITIDGDKESHDSKRYLKNGGPTYDKILRNLKDSYKYLVNVSLRINLDEKNIGSEKAIIKEIESFDKEGKIKAYIARVRNENNTYIDDFCIDQQKFDEYEYNFYKSQHANLLERIYPRTIKNFCTADLKNSYVINYNGDIYKCWSDIGIEEARVGKLSDKKLESINFSNYFKYMIFDPTEDDECKNCKVLPLCMGQCPYQRLNKGRECSKYKDNLKNTLIATKEYMDQINEVHSRS
ncbi:MAG: radical SAM protein [Anaerococcus sp.]|nr:radical SAM protein [Anaerococcus sp.]